MMWRTARRLPRSLLARILFVEVLTILAAGIALSFLARGVLASSVATIESGMLLDQARTIAAGLRHDTEASGVAWHVELSEALQPIYATGYDGRAFAVVDAAGKVLAKSRYAFPASWPALDHPSHAQRFETSSLVGLSLPVTIAGNPVWVVVTQDQTQPGAVVDDVVRAFLPRFLIGLSALLLLMPLITGFILWHSFEKLRRVAQTAATIHPQALDVRLDESGLPAEAGALVRATNELLERVQAAFHMQEEFAANVAHELRTPLAALRVQIGSLADQPTREAMAGEIERMSHVLSQLRDLASLEGAGNAEMTPLELGDFVVTVIAELTPKIFAHGRSIEVVGARQPIIVLANSVLLRIAMLNLVENAIIHTPDGTHITVSLMEDGGIAVADDGPGIAEGDSPHLVRRLWRADHSRSDGAGLGLSIVQRIADAHGGRLLIGSSPEGGALFRLMLPFCAQHP